MMKSRLFLPAFLALAFGNALAVTEFKACSSCFTTSQFAQAAEQFSLEMRPSLIGTDDVFVANPHSGAVRYFRVDRSKDPDFDPLGKPDAFPGSAMPVGPGNSSESPAEFFARGFYLAKAIEAQGDPVIIQSIEAGAEAFGLVMDGVVRRPVSLDELEGLEAINSAVALLGDGQGAYQRVAMQNMLGNHFGERLDAVLVGLDDSVVSAYFNFAVQSPLFRTKYAIKPEFPDGTSMIFSLDVSPYMGDSRNVHWRFKALPESVDGPGLEDGAPQGAYFFNDYRYEGPHAIASEIIALAERSGITTGDEGQCALSCPTDDECVVACQRSGNSQ